MTRSWKSQIGLLSGAQAFSQSISVFIMTLSSLAGAFLTEDASLATLPIAAVILGTLSGLFPAAAWMARRGRGSGFRWGTVFGLGGALGAMGGLILKDLALFSAGHFLMGLQQGSFQYLRFAAAEAVPETRKSQGIAWVLAGGVVAAFLGPWLAHFSRQNGLELPWGLAYGPLVLLYGLVLALLALLPRDGPAPPSSLGHDEKPRPRPLGTIVRQGLFLQALTGSAVGYAVMILLMTATPLAMGHAGHSSSETSWIIQWHVLGMFVPSFFTGTLIQRFGPRPILAAGLLALLGDAVTVLLFGGLVSFWISLTLLGIGWNFLYIASSSRLTAAYRPEEKEKVQALHDIVVFGLNVAATYGAAPLLKTFGWTQLHYGMLPVLGLSALVLLWGRKKPLTS